jgi:hypothetical protein
MSTVQVRVAAFVAALLLVPCTVNVCVPSARPVYCAPLLGQIFARPLSRVYQSVTSAWPPVYVNVASVAVTVRFGPEVIVGVEIAGGAPAARLIAHDAPVATISAALEGQGNALGVPLFTLRSACTAGSPRCRWSR